MSMPEALNGLEIHVKKEPLEIENGSPNHHSCYTQVKHEPGHSSTSSYYGDEVHTRMAASHEMHAGHAHFFRDNNSGSSFGEFKLGDRKYPASVDHLDTTQETTDVLENDTTQTTCNQWRKGRRGPRKVPRFIHEIAEQTRELVEQRLQNDRDYAAPSESPIETKAISEASFETSRKIFPFRHGIDNKESHKSAKQHDLPYMGQITLQGKPRRGRKPKKADICHLISKNYGISIEQAPFQDKKFRRPPLATTNQEQTEPLDLCVRGSTESSHNEHTLLNELCWPSAHFLAMQPTPAIPCTSTGSIDRRTKVPQCTDLQSNQFPTPGHGVLPTTAQQSEVSICKFKFTAGPRPSLERKRMLSVDSIGNFRLYSNIKAEPNNPRCSATSGIDIPTSLRQTAIPGVSKPSGRVQDKRRRKSRKSLMREKLEKTFKEKGFLIQTQQFEAPQGATFCKFRQLRKFTRYLFRSWKDYLPNINKGQPVPTSEPLNESNN